jgi:hypothetical protein
MRITEQQRKIIIKSAAEVFGSDAAQMSLCQIVHSVSAHDKSGIDIMLQAERLKSYLAGILDTRYGLLAAGVEKAVTMV